MFHVSPSKKSSSSVSHIGKIKKKNVKVCPEGTSKQELYIQRINTSLLEMKSLCLSTKSNISSNTYYQVPESQTAAK